MLHRGDVVTFAILQRIFASSMLKSIILVIRPAGNKQEIGRGQFLELSPRCIRKALEISLCRYGFDTNHHIGFPGVWREQLLE